MAERYRSASKSSSACERRPFCIRCVCRQLGQGVSEDLPPIHPFAARIDASSLEIVGEQVEAEVGGFTRRAVSLAGAPAGDPFGGGWKLQTAVLRDWHAGCYGKRGRRLVKELNAR